MGETFGEFQEALEEFLRKLNVQRRAFMPVLAVRGHYMWVEGPPPFTFVRIYEHVKDEFVARYFVRITDGKIFLAKSWVAPDMEHVVGTLKLHHEVNWAAMLANPNIPKECRRKI